MDIVPFRSVEYTPPMACTIRVWYIPYSVHTIRVRYKIRIWYRTEPLNTSCKTTSLIKNMFNKTPTPSFNVYIRNIEHNVFINSIKNPTSSFNINSYVSFSNSGTRSSGLKLRHNTSFTNKQRHFYFNCICRLWNFLLIINMNSSTFTIKNQIKSFFWKHFTANFNPTDSHKLYYLCHSGSCINNSLMNFEHLKPWSLQSSNFQPVTANFVIYNCDRACKNRVWAHDYCLLFQTSIVHNFSYKYGMAMKFSILSKHFSGITIQHTECKYAVLVLRYDL